MKKILIIGLILMCKFAAAQTVYQRVDSLEKEINILRMQLFKFEDAMLTVVSHLPIRADTSETLMEAWRKRNITLCK